MRVRCETCSRFVGVPPPREGDGRFVRLRSHERPAGGLCTGERLVDPDRVEYEDYPPASPGTNEADQ